MKRKKRIMQIQHVSVNCFLCFHQRHCSVAGTLPSPVLFGAFLHISWTMLLQDEIEKRTLRRYMTNNHGLKHMKQI